MNKRNAVAHETGVIVTGARPGASAAKRELFTENTTSVLVFENGGVIRLGTDVIAGQLLFLTHRESKREVVAQVTRKQRFNAGSPYVELEFTESAPGFWGTEFPMVPETAKNRVEEAARLAPAAATDTELYVLEEAIGGPAKAVAGPRAEEVEQLKQEVEALREQLQSMKRSASVETIPAPLAAANEAEAVPVRTNVPKMRLPDAGEARPRGEAPNASPSAAEAMGEESVDSEIAAFAAQDLFPPVALDFAKADQAIERAAHEKAQFRGTSTGGTLRLALLGAGLVAAIAGGAWYEGWLPLPSHAEAVPSGTPVVTGRRAPGAAAVPVGRPQAGAIRPDSGGKTTANTAGATKGANFAGIPENPGPRVMAESGTSAEAEPESSRESASSRDAENAKSTAGVVKRENERSERRAEATEVSMAGEAAMTEPPRLIEAVKAVPPPGFVTGNVVLDAVVDASGHVKSMRVLSGPESLRNAAVDALKKYRYAPAMQNGKAVSGHVQATVQFWYEP